MTARTFLLVVLVAAGFLGAACAKPSSERDNGGPEAAAPTGEAAHASAEVVPGSYEDWCAEHGVPETQCTRCDASLIPAFQASNDWCAEHGLPESQCLLCNPGLKIVRPPKPEGD